MRVKFSTADEFLEELTKECTGTAGPYAIDDKIVRLTFRYQQTKTMPIVHMSIIAGAVVRGKIIELNQYIDQIMDAPAAHEASDRVKAKAEIIRANIEAKARDLHLEIRAGMFEP
jgi:hypothetical protein